MGSTKETLKEKAKRLFNEETAQKVANVDRAGDYNDRFEQSQYIRDQRRFVSSESLRQIYY